ncbi:hypothetical protein, conserved [Trypanosoma brucei gambiense DAL972]|uniref:Uncharacterized protein n=2 Tax=Trypanosoma brucei TaxID=5691 RepID=C9ZN62_TRYB9|nr:hypothetical protein, conserved [Trypanosoma brucei gambiense DAL972]RHW72734.1 hypothetical protein DPX39_040071300 [Trypanosoma brucei equiperdum]CBH10716.1 hypothetical protein, conserved [Trypanosoma brucei gambiense DAL972]|eukprot:XP_011773004.1 hypothetical protein, conserved [Trypanosoma brucei gambiense DAL972]
MDNTEETSRVTDQEERTLTETELPAPAEHVLEGDNSASEENRLHAFLIPLEDGEQFARANLQHRWYRGLTKMLWDEELERNGILIVERGESGRNNQSADEEEEEDDDGTDDCVAKMKREFRIKREQDKIVYEEDSTRTETLREEQNAISLIVTLMEEAMDRSILMSEAETMFALILDVLKPRVHYRYIYAWGVVTCCSFKPLKSEMDRLRPSDRHKPPYMRKSLPTCRVPLEPIYYLPDGGKKMRAMNELNDVRAIGWV